MTYNPVKPRYSLPFNGQQYELLGTFELIEAAENALQTGILQIGRDTMDLPVGKTARLLSAVLTASGHKTTVAEAGTVLAEMGVNGEEFALLKLHLYAALRVFVSTPAEREQVSNDMGEMFGKLEKPASRGKSTRSSATAS